MARPRKNMVTITLTLSFSLFSLIFSKTTQATSRPTPLYVFGDSLYDSGMTTYNGRKGAGAEYWPYGDTFFKKPAGRYSDGRLIPDFLAEYAGLPFPEAYYNPALEDYSKAVSFAAAGSCALVQLRPTTLNLKKQIKLFREEMIPKLKEQVGEDDTNKLLTKAVYLLNIGANDYATLFENNYAKRMTFINHIVGNITLYVKAIYKLGGKKFAFQNVGPLGYVPTMKNMLGSEGSGHEEAQEIARMHNEVFLAYIKKLEPELPGFKYAIHDFHSSISSRVLDGQKYGFIETQKGCCGTGDYNGEFTCQKKGKSFSVCSNPNDYLWFDAAHPTDKANQQFAKEIWSGSSDIIGPVNLQTLFAM